jgi:DNA modification methylase
MVQYEQIFKGYTDCGCGAEFEAGVVLDIFMGSGTTACVAIKNKRNYTGIELNPEYIEICNKRIAQAKLESSQLSLL